MENARLPQRCEDVGWHGAEGSLPVAHGELSEAAPGPRAERGGRSARGGVWRCLHHPVEGTNHGAPCGAGRPRARTLGPRAQGPATRHPLVSGPEAERWKRAGHSTADFTVVETGDTCGCDWEWTDSRGLCPRLQGRQEDFRLLTMYGLNEQNGHKLTSTFPVFKTLVTLGMIYNFLRCS